MEKPPLPPINNFQTESEESNEVVTESSFQFSLDKKDELLKAIGKFMDKSLRKIQRAYLVKFGIAESFYNLDIKQDRFSAQVFELVRNSFDNFIQESIENGVVTITFSSSQDRLSCRVRDNGSGVSNEEREKLFSGAVSSKRLGSGTFGWRGAGLKDSKEWAIKQGGDVNYKPLERGSEFTLYVNPYIYITSP